MNGCSDCPGEGGIVVVIQHSIDIDIQRRPIVDRGKMMPDPHGKASCSKVSLCADRAIADHKVAPIDIRSRGKTETHTNMRARCRKSIIAEKVRAKRKCC